MTTEDPTPRPSAENLTWCVSPGADDDLAGCDTKMALEGLHRVRTLVQLRRSLPLDAASRADIPAVVTRPFDPGKDSEALLEVNNAAFHWHPEQGGWDRARLDSALAEPWVDPEGILVHEADTWEPHAGPQRLDGFCWTRIHPATDPEIIANNDPALGEIFVIATHPRVHGTRLGPALVAAGLDHLHRRGLEVANLYTESDNHAALRMYDRMGFTIHEYRGGYQHPDRVDP